MKRLFGIVYELTLSWIAERTSDFEFDYDGKEFLFDDGIFYYSETTGDDQDSDWEEVENKTLLFELEIALLVNEEIETAFMEFVEGQLIQLFKENDIINTIEEIKNI